MKKMKGPIQAYDSFKSSIEDLSKEIHKGVDAVITKFKVKAKQVKQMFRFYNNIEIVWFA